MAKFCVNCGRAVNEESVYCPSCGMVLQTPVVNVDEDMTIKLEIDEAVPKAPEELSNSFILNEEPTLEPTPMPNPDISEKKEQPVHTNIPPVAPPYRPEFYTPAYSPMAQDTSDMDKVVSTAKFFWFSVLYAIPFVGFILTIIMSFVSENRSFKNFSKAWLITQIISIVLSILSFVLLFALGAMFADSINENFTYFIG